MTARATPFSSPQSAQFWREWSERGYVLPVGYALIGIGALPLVLYVEARSRQSLEGLSSLFFLFPLAGIGFFWGSRSPQLEFGDFHGSRPLSDRQLANAVLKSATLGLVLSALIWAVVLIVEARLGQSRLYREIQAIGAFGSLLRAALGAIATWSAVGLLTSLVLAGQRPINITVWPAIGIWIVGALLSRFVFHESQRRFELVYFSACLVCCLVVCAATFVVSWRRHLISAGTLWLAAMLVLISGSIAVAAAHSAGWPLDWKLLLPMLGCCGLTPIPLAAAPMAVYVNRHR
jgi:hypothetical protein